MIRVHGVLNGMSDTSGRRILCQIKDVDRSRSVELVGPQIDSRESVIIAVDEAIKSIQVRGHRDGYRGVNPNVTGPGIQVQPE